MPAVVDLAATDSRLSNEQAEEILRTVTIPPCPSILMTLMHEARQDEVDFPKIVRLIAADVSLAAAMLKTANSPFFALRSKVQNVQQAVAVLGLKNLVSIVTSVSIRASLSPPGVNMERFWDRSGYSATAAAMIARRTRLVDRDLAYTFGLFHDCGIPVLMMRFGNYKETLGIANDTSRGFTEIENERHNTNHATVGSMLARNWHLPGEIVEAIDLHHDYPSAFEGRGTGNAVRALIAIVHLADHFTARFLGQLDEREWVTRGDDYVLYLGFDTDEIIELYAEVKDQLVEIRDSKV